MAVEEVRIETPAGLIGVSLRGPWGVLLVLGHGAGGDRRTPLLVDLAERLAQAGCGVALYSFPYSEAGRRIPDPRAVLEQTVREVDADLRRRCRPRLLFHGGKSMGGRMASQAVAQGLPADGLVFLGYPLHPSGRPETLRDRHLPAIQAPMLFLQGTRDAFARWDLISDLVARLGPHARLERVEGADHSFSVPKASGRGPHEVRGELVAKTLAWLEARRVAAV